MERTLKWKKRFFKRTSEIYSGDTLIGTLKEHFWTGNATSELNNKRWYFRTKGFFKRRTEISYAENEEVLATARYRQWRREAAIELAYKPELNLTWKYEDLWHRRSSISEPSGLMIKYHGSQFSGEIISDIDDDLLIITGLFINNYFRRMAAAAAAGS